MTPEHIDAWLKALRGNDYKQQFNALMRKHADGNRHCCIGVAASVICAYGLPERLNSTYDACVLVGLAPCGGKPLNTYGAHDCFMFMNDTMKMSFSQIADWAEARKEKLMDMSADWSDEFRALLDEWTRTKVNEPKQEGAVS